MKSQAKVPSKRFSWADRIASFGHAFRGIAVVLRFEHNAWIHAAATAAVICMGIGFRIDRVEWLVILLAVAMVWTAEALNTAIEALCDVVSPDHDVRIQRAKDAAAGAVLSSALGALGAGLWIFVPRIALLLGVA